MSAAVDSEMLMTAPRASATEIGDDMFDSRDELPSHESVREAIEFCNSTLTLAYKQADARALRHQKWHRSLAIIAAILGTAAVLFSILQLPHLLPDIGQLEATAVAIAAVAVASGLLLSFQSRWQIERNKAERCRLLKFRFLIDPGFWCSDSLRQSQLRDGLKADVVELGTLTSKRLEEWTRKEQWIEDRALVSQCTAEPEAIRALVGYYRAKRIGTQGRFFEKRLTQFRGHHRKTWHIASLLFLGSIIAALAHFILDLSHEPAEMLNNPAAIGRPPLSTVLILLAAGLPAIAAGVRTLRSTYEFARNAMRYEAKLLALRALERSLAAEFDRETPDYRRIFHDLWCCEQVMEFEHREWLRLMIEAEWY
jgi:hypothetical protein